MINNNEKLIQLISKELNIFTFNVQRAIGYLTVIKPNNIVDYIIKG
ncbi:hypothetical protein RES5_001330 [Staphylococcus haemolyticus]|nr:hypothetical protein [Staphylococcus haemolyticus]UCI00117.1 hypothetical protein RES5_001330 [Staphylococcus haemolyticus]UCI02335.1 hypothetical protein RES6_001315 [Staphylococcus haemolyticus]